ncbi:MAG: MaoC family dehydratase N-terminal domain-containing protein [Deltaproteobacteria bacterium]|nr:MaoC family dehydratase N-terminal domain-containing protein [Deltaproteobacteria bacterium]
MPLNRNLLGKVYDTAPTWTVEADATRAYAAATNTHNPWYVDTARQGGIIAPPIYGVVYQFLALGLPMFDTELGVNMLRLVHGEQDMRFLAPVHPGDVIRTTATVKAITDKTSGELLDIDLISTNQHGVKVAQTLTGVFIRGRTRGARKEEAPRQEEAPPSGKVVLETTVEVAKDQSLRYADASGDHNPIHKDPDMARAAGLPDIILHGMCGMAFLQNAVVDGLCGGDPTRLRRLRVRFAKPVLMGDVLTIKAFDTGTPGTLAAEVSNPAGVVLMSSGIAELG